MNYYQIRNFDKYQASYKDGRKLIWIKWYIDSLSDYKFIKLTTQQKWLFIGLAMLQCKERGKIPQDHEWICQQLQYEKKHISSDIKALLELNILVTSCDEILQDCTNLSQNVVLEEKRREENRKEKNIEYMAFENRVLDSWKVFAERYPQVSSIMTVTPSRREKLKTRYRDEQFRDFEKILNAIEEQPFCLGDGKSSWTVSFDWLIENDVNYVKILERKYKEARATDAPRVL